MPRKAKPVAKASAAISCTCTLPLIPSAQLTEFLVVRQRRSAGTTASKNSSRRSSRFGDMIKNSSEVESAGEPDALSTAPSPGCMILKAVEIPALRRSAPSNAVSDSASTLSEDIPVSVFSARDRDTPGTSAVATPVNGRSMNTAKTRKASAELQDAVTTLRREGSQKKRARSSVKTKEEQEGEDKELAKALQEAEYASDQRVDPSMPPRHRREMCVEVSDELGITDDEPAPKRRRRAIKAEDDDDFMNFDTAIKQAASGIVGDAIAKQVREASGQRRTKVMLESKGASIRQAKSRASASMVKFVVDTDTEDDDASIYSSDDLSNITSVSGDDSLLNADPNIATPQSPRHRLSPRPWRRKQKPDFARAQEETRSEYERRKLEAAHPELKTMWQQLRSVEVIKPEKAKQPEGINRQLKSFQLEGLNWMLRQEQSRWKGGLLGDEMGMGKTIQAVSLIMSDYPAGKPTLVVVPPVALMQWSAEIKAYTSGKLKVLVHHNTDPSIKKMAIRELKRYDVIMISYAGLESIHRKEVKGWKRDDGLVKENSRIHNIHYHRLILDEAHSIKSRTTGVAKACFALKADFKWCLSGTPVQNRIGEFFSLLRFLEVKPFACYFCKACPCAELHWAQNDEHRCMTCDHSGFNHVSIFNQELLLPITQGEDPVLRAEALAKLRLITDRIMLRRLKRDHTSSMELPPKHVIIHNEFFGPVERDFSTSIMSSTTRQFDTYVSRGVMLNNYANIFGLIMQMRQVANHPDLILKRHANGGQNVLVCSICDEPAEEPIKSKCHHEFCRSCAKDYVRSFEAGNDPDCPRCHIPLAIDFDQADIEQDEEAVKKSSIINRIRMEEWHSSTKIEMLIYDLYKLRSKKQTHKSIVFSQFTSMLQLVEWRLRRAGFNTVMLDGSMSPAQRQRSINFFMDNVEVEIFLVSLKAGGVALNLTEASRVFIIDP